MPSSPRYWGVLLYLLVPIRAFLIGALFSYGWRMYPRTGLRLLIDDVTLEIHSGMSYDEVVEMLGPEGGRLSNDVLLRNLRNAGAPYEHVRPRCLVFAHAAACLSVILAMGHRAALTKQILVTSFLCVVLPGGTVPRLDEPGAKRSRRRGLCPETLEGGEFFQRFLDALFDEALGGGVEVVAPVAQRVRPEAVVCGRLRRDAAWRCDAEFFEDPVEHLLGVGEFAVVREDDAAWLLGVEAKPLAGPFDEPVDLLADELIFIRTAEEAEKLRCFSSLTATLVGGGAVAVAFAAVVMIGGNRRLDRVAKVDPDFFHAAAIEGFQQRGIGANVRLAGGAAAEVEFERAGARVPVGMTLDVRKAPPKLVIAEFEQAVVQERAA